jgi:hypothetical protein
MPPRLRALLAHLIANEILSIAALHAGDDFGWWELCEWGIC